MYRVAQFFLALFVETPRALWFILTHGERPVRFKDGDVRRIKEWLKGREIK